MAILDMFKRKKELDIKQALGVITAYSPSFSSFGGGIYEMDLTRSAIHTLSTHRSKLNPVFKNTGRYSTLAKKLRVMPNEYMVSSQFLYKLSTIYEVENNAFIVPLQDNLGRTLGLYPVSSTGSSIVTHNGVQYFRFEINNQPQAIEYKYVGHLKKHFYNKDIYAENNSPLIPTMELIDTQNQGIINGIKNGALVRFIGRLTNTFTPSQLIDERKRLLQENFGIDNSSGIVLLDNKYAELKQIESKPFLVDGPQREIIQKNVEEYFGVSKEIITNSGQADWEAFYEGAIEPFAVQLSQVITKMLFSEAEIVNGAEVHYEANRIQFMKTADKINMITQMFDRGLMSHNEGREVLNMAPIDGGDKHYIRKEYTEVSQLDADTIGEENASE